MKKLLLIIPLLTGCSIDWDAERKYVCDNGFDTGWVDIAYFEEGTIYWQETYKSYSNRYVVPMDVTCSFRLRERNGNR